MNYEVVRAVIDQSRPDVLRDRCLVVSLAVQEIFGGELVMYRNPGRPEHFVNCVLDQVFDFTEDHAGATDPEVLDSPRFLHSVPRVADQLKLFRSRLREQFKERLPIAEIQHVVIQELAENPGSHVHPDFSCVLMLGSRERHLDADLFAPMQTFWLKFTNGPIVARARLTKWLSASRLNWTDDDIRSACHDSVLSTHRATWNRLSESTAGQFLLMWLEAAEPLDVPIYPRERGSGRAIIPLPTRAHQVAWLDSDCDVHFALESAPTVRYQPFYRFRWEDELDIEVSRAIDDRMPKSGRFFDRVRIVNHALREYFSFIENNADLEESFTEDEITMLAEILEDREVDGSALQRELVRDVQSIGQELAVRASADGVALLHLARHVESLSATQFAVLMDTVYTVVPRLSRIDKGLRSRDGVREDDADAD